MRTVDVLDKARPVNRRRFRLDRFRFLVCVITVTLVAYVEIGIHANSCLAQSSPVSVELIEGSVNGQLQTVGLDFIGIDKGDGLTKIPFEQVAKIDFGVPVIKPTGDVIEILLVDGSKLNAKQFTITKRDLNVELHCGVSITVNARDVEYIRLADYENDLELNRQWREILADETREGDAIIVKRSNELNAVEGVVGELAGEKLEFSIGEQSARVPLSKIEAMLFYHAKGRELATPLADVYLPDGSVLSSRRMTLENANLTAIAVCGAKMSFSLDAVSEINFELGRDSYLSQLSPATNDWQPLMTSSSILERLRKMKLARANETFSGKPLSLRFFEDNGIGSPGQIKHFENGFCVYGGSRLSFNLNGQYSQLSGFVGFNPEASLSGKVKFRVILDGEAVLEKVLIHRTMKNPLQIDLDVKDVDRIVFQVEYHDGRSTGDQLHLVDMKVSR